MTESKPCKTCKSELPLTEFSKDPTCKDGRKVVCKKCIAKRRVRTFHEKTGHVGEFMGYF